jgi:DNA polymerase III subunit epsilon
MISEDIFKIPFKEAEYCVIDVETTGLSPRYNGIIEIGIVKVAGLKIVDTYQSLINPGRTIPYYITSFTGISDDDVYNAPFFEDVADEISGFISNSVLAGHNFSFDKSFIRKEFIYSQRESPENPQLCTQRLSGRVYPDLRRRSLSILCRYLGINHTNKHRALPDAEVTAKVLIRMLEQLKDNPEIKTVEDLVNFQSMPLINEGRIKISKHLKEDVISLPDSPGIYYFLNSKKKVIYIGKAKSLKNRVRSYFLLTAHRKAKKIVKQARRIKYDITNSELTALLSEAELIKLINPKHNSQLKQYGSKYFLRINTTHPFPDLEITNKFDFDGNDYFGLFLTKKKAAVVYEIIKKAFSIRECTNTEFLKGQACFLADIERCIAPCVSKDKFAYKDEIDRAYEFLYGKNQTVLNRLLNKMREYSGKQKYEKAGETKELIDLILSQTHKTSLLKEPVNAANVLFVISEKFGKDYILMLQGRIFVKDNSPGKTFKFDTALEDFFNDTINTNSIPDEEDLEKMKITLNWIVKNRNKVKIFYLKEYQSKEELFSKVSSLNFSAESHPVESTFDILDFVGTNP